MTAQTAIAGLPQPESVRAKAWDLMRADVETWEVKSAREVMLHDMDEFLARAALATSEC